MTALQQALEQYRAQERERELARKLRREVTRSILARRQFTRMRTVIPQWWEWVCTGLVYVDPQINALIDLRLADTAGLAQAIAEDWA